MKRREFLGGLMSGVAVAASGALLFPTAAWPETIRGNKGLAARPGPTSLSIKKRVLEVNGRAAEVFGLVQPDGTVGLTLDADTLFDVVLSNEGGEPTLIHWHGLAPPWDMDGVPDNPAALLEPKKSRRYTFPVGPGGTHWMHAHTLQEQKLLAAPLIVQTAEDKKRDEQDVVILLHDFSFTPAEELLATLKSSAGGHAMDHNAMSGMAANMHGGHMSGMATPGMVPMDLNDIEYDAYLANDRTLDDPEVVAVENGGRVRLRIINGATATAFTIDTGALTGELIAVDGQLIRPVSATRFPISMGQRLDVRLELPKAAMASPVLALREGSDHRTGIILAPSGARVGKLATRGVEVGPIIGLDLEQQLAATASIAARRVDRRFELTLTGGMSGYEWGIDGADSLYVREGERVEIVMRNMSMMAHPMHLHGHHFQVSAIDGRAFPGALRDTVLVPPMGSATFAFDANNPGRWPLHCHHLYHMASGMMSFVAYT